MKINYLIASIIALSSPTLFAEAPCPDITYDMIGKEAEHIFNLENKALTSDLSSKNDVDNLKKSAEFKTITVGGKAYEMKDAVFATTRNENPQNLGDYLKNKGADYVLKGKMQDGVCKYFLTTVLEFDLKAK